MVKACSRHKKGLCLAPSNPQPADQFWASKSAKDGRQSWCKTCSSVVTKQHRMQRDPEIRRQYDRQRYAANPERYRAKVLVNRVKYHPYRKFKKAACEDCGFIAQHPCQLDVDHKDGDHLNHSPDNLRTLCSNCHRLKTWLSKDCVVYRIA